MSVASTSSYRPNRDAVIKGALHLVGALHAADTPDADQYNLGMSFLMDGMLSLQAKGVTLQTRIYETLTLVSGTASYATPADTLSVEDGAVVRELSGLDGPSSIMTQKDYYALPDKTTPGRPSRYYPEYTSSGITLFLWQVPDSSWTTLYYPRVRRIRDLTTGNLDLDCPTTWMLGMKMFVAWMFAIHYKRPVEMCEMRRMIWEGQDGEGGLKRDLIAAESERGPLQLEVPEIIPRWC